MILIVGILSTIATVKMLESTETARYEQTKNELDQLAMAIAGNPNTYADGMRSDFGYVGDMGALPPGLEALVRNPGGYATWHGPYIEVGINGDDFKKDAWNTPYTYSGTSITSSGSGSPIERPIASSTAALLSNSVEGVVRDANRTAPGPAFTNTMQIQLIYPDGSGSIATSTVNPDQYGEFSFSGVPVGNHTLRTIYIPRSDTTTLIATVNPNRTTCLEVVFPADLW
jgi:hypothetical protein